MQRVKSFDTILGQRAKIMATRCLEHSAKQLEATMTPIISLPFESCLAFDIDEANAARLSASAFFIYLAADIADDIADGDFATNWGDGLSIAEGSLASIIFFSCYAPLTIDSLATDSPRQSIIKSTISSGILDMAAGQQCDFEQTINNYLTITPEQVIDNVRGKSGGELSCFARMAGQLSNANEQTLTALSAMGRAIGIAGQLISDCFDLVSNQATSDLASGILTLPVVHHLSSLNHAEKETFRALLIRAQHDRESRVQISKAVTQSGALSTTDRVIRSYKDKALQELKLLPIEASKKLYLRKIIVSKCKQF